MQILWGDLPLTKMIWEWMNGLTKNVMSLI